ncbi:ABC transporter substrate-binding protein [Paenibacillus ginsengarvi]|uniref:Extracellular solute-binding protein n=1 Tax=Paenibacillus ginsengarvi TaxID=400777 RepID=A0A3B0CHN5_9BACL|nr:extracellular solute-binding protein [Paenibacillus ginsengarvi]RKN85235.1 extracellular solute-binding protein [Paenibacillus ginsengarvi]
MVKHLLKKSAAAGIAIAVIASGCGKSDEGSKGGADKDTKAAAVDYTKGDYEVVIQDLAGGSDEPFEKSFGQYIRKKFPNFKITFIQSKEGTKLQDLTLAGQNVDIVYASLETISGPLLASGQQFDMSGLIKEHGVDLNKFEQTTIDAVRTMGDGKIYYLPVTTMVQVMFYNKGIFDKLGVPYPKDGMTWDDVHAMNQKLTRNESGINYMGYSASPNHILRMNQMSVPMYDPKTKKPMLTDERWKAAIERYFLNEASSSYKTWSTEKKKLPYYTEMTASQELATIVFNSQFPFDGPQYVKDIDWDLVALPTTKDKPKLGSQASPRMFAITGTAKNKGPAMEVIKQLTSVEVQTEISKQGFMTVLNDDNVKKLIGSESQFKNKNWKAVYYNEIAPKSYQSIYDGDILQKFLSPVVLKVVTGQTDLNTALREAQDQAEKFVQAEQQK